MNATAEDQVLVEKLGFSKCNAIPKEAQEVVQNLTTNYQFKESSFCIHIFENLSIQEAEAIGEALKVNYNVEDLLFISLEIYHTKVCDVFLKD